MAQIPFEYMALAADVQQEHLDDKSIREILQTMADHYSPQGWSLAGHHLFPYSTTLVVFLVRVDQSRMQAPVMAA